MDERKGEGDCELDMCCCVSALRKGHWREESGGDVGREGFKDGLRGRWRRTMCGNDE